uniref:Glycosyltransferase RgtA/B/C/D-like domain-containing protein n=1 Tax=Solibacter usitatus (strain Ellin6076) TaxID=234267 RepID=Q01PI6_SOLUE
MNPRRSVFQFLLPGTAFFAFVWAVARACVQSITIDEADTYLAWVARPNPSHWEAASNNHVLNSLLMRLFTSVFGVSHLTVRAPALLGAAIYIASIYLLCVRLAPALQLQWPLFVCLVYNPFIFDHLVAARGYALALGFLTAALAIGAYCLPDLSTCAMTSVCLALSFAANFSFAFVDLAAMLAIFIWACARTQAIQARARLLGACVLPGLLVSVFVSAPGVLHWPKGQLEYGAHSLRETFHTVAEASLYRPNPQIVNPILLGWIEQGRVYLLPLVLALAAWQWARHRNAFAMALLAIAAAALGAHWLTLKLFHVLLPRDRTAIWIVPLLTLAIGAAAANRRALTCMLYVMSIYYLLCLRLTYFKEWSWDADVNRIYPVVAWYNHTYGVTDVASSWLYSASLNFYRLQSGRESLDEIPGQLQPSGGHALYVLNWAFDEAFLKEQHLRVVYRAPDTDAVVAIRPQLEAHAFPIN